MLFKKMYSTPLSNISCKYPAFLSALNTPPLPFGVSKILLSTSNTNLPSSDKATILSCIKKCTCDLS